MWAKYLTRSRRDMTKRRSYLYWRIKAHRDGIKDFCMTPRQYRIAWGDMKTEIKSYGFRSQLMQYHMPFMSAYLSRKLKRRKDLRSLR